MHQYLSILSYIARTIFIFICIDDMSNIYKDINSNITMIDLIICCDEFNSYKDQRLIYYIQGSNKNGAFINLKEIEKPMNILYCPFCGESISQVME